MATKSEIECTLACGCGRTVTARARDAGGSIACECGRAVAVPKLSELRTMAGADAYVTNPAEAIRKAQHEGINPAGDNCLVCGSPTPDIYRCHATCESSHVRKNGSNAGVLHWLLLPLAYLPFYGERADASQPDRQGHDVEVSFELPVCGPCAGATGNVTRPRTAKKLMGRVPLYRELLAYYPELKLQVERPAS